MKGQSFKIQYFAISLGPEAVPKLPGAGYGPGYSVFKIFSAPQWW